MILDNSIKNFYDSLEKLEVRNKAIDSKISLFKKYMDNFKINIEQANILIDCKNRDLCEYFNSILEKIKLMIENQNILYSKFLEQEKFKSDLKNKFIVIVYGKVKAGKSYLGNFIAKNSNKNPYYFMYDGSQNKKPIENFKTDEQECTANIQGFEIDSFIWIDTPGFSSVTLKNGELAKEYINSADFIIYISNSDSSFQLDEMKELSELVQNNKKITILLTRSDRVENNEIDGEITTEYSNLTDEERQAIEEQTRNKINQYIANSDFLLGDILSISVKMANNAILNKASQDEFKKSNMPKLYEILTSKVLPKAQKLKNISPYSGLVDFINKLLNGENSIQNLKNDLNDFGCKTNELKNDFEQFKKKLILDMKIYISNLIDEQSDSIDENNIRGLFEELQIKINKEYNTRLEAFILEKMQNYHKKLEKMPIFLEYEIKNSYKKLVIKKNRGFIIGGIVGAIAIAPFTGLLTAATVGLGVGSAIGGGLLNEDDSKFIKIGDNKMEQILKFKHDLSNLYEVQINKDFDCFNEDIFIKIEKHIKTLFSIIDKFENNIKNLLGELKW